MKIVELYLRVRQSVFVEGRSRRETARLFGIARKTVDKMCAFGDVPAHVANGRALLINDYAASPLQARPPSLVAGVKRAA